MPCKESRTKSAANPAAAGTLPDISTIGGWILIYVSALGIALCAGVPAPGGAYGFDAATAVYQQPSPLWKTGLNVINVRSRRVATQRPRRFSACIE